MQFFELQYSLCVFHVITLKASCFLSIVNPVFISSSDVYHHYHFIQMFKYILTLSLTAVNLVIIVEQQLQNDMLIAMTNLALIMTNYLLSSKMVIAPRSKSFGKLK